MRAHERQQVVEAFGPPRDPRSTRSTPRDLFLVAPGRRHGSRGEAARSSAATFIEVFEDEARTHPGRALPGPGHALPGRHRVGVDQGPLRGDQDAPQRRRPAGAAGIRAHRAGPGALQGRGAPARAPSSGSRASSWRATRSRAPAWRCGSRARSRAEKVAILQKADEIVLEEIRTAGLYDAISQAFAVLLPVRSVGVMGDGRTHEFVLAVRAVQTDRLHDRRLVPACRTRSSDAIAEPRRRIACAASTASSTTSPPSRRRRSSGSDATAGPGPAARHPEGRRPEAADHRRQTLSSRQRRAEHGVHPELDQPSAASVPPYVDGRGVGLPPPVPPQPEDRGQDQPGRSRPRTAGSRARRDPPP